MYTPNVLFCIRVSLHGPPRYLRDSRMTLMYNNTRHGIPLSHFGAITVTLQRANLRGQPAVGLQVAPLGPYEGV